MVMLASQHCAGALSCLHLLCIGISLDAESLVCDRPDPSWASVDLQASAQGLLMATIHMQVESQCFYRLQFELVYVR